jgi:hypothetical protein
MIGAEAIQALMDREFGILDRRIAKSGPSNHYAVARYDAVRQVANELRTAENSESWGTVRSIQRRLDAIAQLFPSFQLSEPRSRRTTERSVVICRELLAELFGNTQVDTASGSSSTDLLDHSILLSGKMWQANSYPSNPPA